MKKNTKKFLNAVKAFKNAEGNNKILDEVLNLAKEEMRGKNYGIENCFYSFQSRMGGAPIEVVKAIVGEAFPNDCFSWDTYQEMTEKEVLVAFFHQYRNLKKETI